MEVVIGLPTRMTCIKDPIFPHTALNYYKKQSYLAQQQVSEIKSGQLSLLASLLAVPIAGGSARRRGQPGHNMESDGWKLGRTYVGSTDRPPKKTTTLRTPVLSGRHKLRPADWAATTAAGKCSYRTGREAGKAFSKNNLFGLWASRRDNAKHRTSEVLSSALMHSCKVRATPPRPNHRALLQMRWPRLHQPPCRVGQAAVPAAKRVFGEIVVALVVRRSVHSGWCYFANMFGMASRLGEKHLGTSECKCRGF
ncbi:hypothetical protein QBC34DRAFT_219235 [Podospora aff. communis PSN243]|uniref:Uncharacterized protein n=1 Tax=Podospora aff. communis PSN243 TaxID=3040156 RepID=A0AAV9GYW1_9PEZI|nr:hypothetical protein QBC34DRAFT_219235 [Podospora aff. communis PSN243]